MARGVDELDGDGADLDDVAAGVGDQVAVVGTGDPLDPLGFVGLDVDRHRAEAEQLIDPGDGVARHLPADVVGVVVGGEGASQGHAVLVEDPEQVLDAVGGVNDDGLTGLPVADQVHEVDHLAGHRIGGREVAPGEQLTEVEAVIGHPLRLRPPVDPPDDRHRRNHGAVGSGRWPSGARTTPADRGQRHRRNHRGVGSGRSPSGARNDADRPGSHGQWRIAGSTPFSRQYVADSARYCLGTSRGGP